jgi:hypothetical protein
MRKITKRSAAIIGATVIAIGGGAAWAAWSVSGSATASASAGTASAVQVTGAVLTGPLLPGDPTGVSFQVYNPNSFTVDLTGAGLSGFATTQSGCANSNFVATPTTFAPTTLIAGETKTVVLAGSVGLKPDADNACQGAPITFTVSVNAESAA